MQNKSIYNLYQLWLYFVDKKYWDQIYYLYNNILEQDCEFYLEFKKYIDTNSKTDSYGNILNHDYLIKAMPTDKRRRLLDLFKSVAPIINKKHIICDIDDTLLKTYELPNHDFSMKNNNYRNTFYPYLSQYISEFINQESCSSKFATFCTLRGNYLYEYTKNKIISNIKNNHILISDNFIFMYYTIIQIFNIDVMPFTKQWYNKFFYGGISKFNKINRFLNVYPEFTSIFIGDTGEGDLITGTFLLLDSRITHVFLYDIKNNENSSYIKYNQKLYIHKLNINFCYQKISKKTPDDMDTIKVDIHFPDNKIISKNIFLFDNFVESDIKKIFRYIKEYK